MAALPPASQPLDVPDARATGSPDADEKRARILEAAYRVCERSGVDGARMEEVAARAGVSKGTLYRFFASKERLLLATILDSYERHLPLLDARARPGAGARERLEALLHGMAEVFAAIAPRMPVHHQAPGLVAKDPELEAELHAFLRRFHADRHDTLVRTLRDGQREGAFRDDLDVAAVAEGVQALLSGFLYRAAFDPERATADQLRRSFAALVLEAVLPAGVGESGRRRG